jgi:hypothetical protein
MHQADDTNRTIGGSEPGDFEQHLAHDSSGGCTQCLPDRQLPPTSL